MGQLYLDFNQQYNAVIGGRGTGKSTILEYLRWGLCDQILDLAQEKDDIPGYQDKRKKLIEKTLIPFDATVQVSFIKNSISHIIRRKASSNEVLLKIGTGEFEPCSEENARNLLPIQAYSQKQLSSVGVSIDELRRLLYSPVRQALGEYDSTFEKLRAEIKGCQELRLKKMIMESEVRKNDLELKSLTEQVDGLRKGLKGILKDDEEIIASHERYEVIEELVSGWKDELMSAKESVENIIKEIEEYPTEISEDTQLPDQDQAIVKDIYEEVQKVFDGINGDLGALNKKLDDKGEGNIKIDGLMGKWEGVLDKNRTLKEMLHLLKLLG